MAVSYISTPQVDPARVSFSYPGVIVLYSSVYATANVTQHRFKLEIIVNSVVVATKYTVVDDETNKYGRFDVKEIFKSLISLTILQRNSTNEVTKITGNPVPVGKLLDESVSGRLEITVEAYEEYFLSGVFTQNTAGQQDFIA